MALGIYEEEDIRAIAEEIRAWGQTDKTYTVKQMVQGVNDVASAAHSDGYVGGHTAGVEEGKAIGYEEGQRDGYESGRADGITDGFYEGEAIGYQNGITEGIEQGKTEAYAEVDPINTQLENTLNGTDTGGKSFYDEFWDSVFASSIGSNKFSGSSWTDVTFKPNRNIQPTGSCQSMFTLSRITDLVGILRNHNVVLDLSGSLTRCDNMFAYCYNLTTVPYIDTTNFTSGLGLQTMFCECPKLHTIMGIKLKADGSQAFTSTFENCKDLENLTIEGTIGQNGFNVQWSTKLSKASIISIINALSTTTSGLSVTLSKTAVETAFGSTESEEWIALINTRSNWTINLV